MSRPADREPPTRALHVLDWIDRAQIVADELESQLDLERQMRRILIDLSMLSNGRIARLDPGTFAIHRDHDHEPDPIPRFGDKPPHLYWIHLWHTCRTDEDRRFTIDRASKELEQLRRRPVAWRGKDESRADRDARIITYGSGLAVNDVAISARCGPRDVRRARLNAGLDPERGLPIPDASPVDGADARRDTARRLHTGGMTATEIAQRLGASVSTIRRDLGLKASRRDRG